MATRRMQLKSLEGNHGGLVTGLGHIAKAQMGIRLIGQDLALSDAAETASLRRLGKAIREATEAYNCLAENDKAENALHAEIVAECEVIAATVEALGNLGNRAMESAIRAEIATLVYRLAGVEQRLLQAAGGGSKAA